MPLKDLEARKAYARRQYEAKQQEAIEYARQQRAERGDEINERRRELYAQRPEEWHAAYLEYQRSWHQERPGYATAASRKRRAEHAEETRAYFAQRRGQAALGMSVEDKAESAVWRKLIADDPCYYCGTVSAEAYEDDHYVTVANGGTDHWWNLVRACRPCNRSKGAMNGDVFRS